MDWLKEFLLSPSPTQAVVLLFLLMLVGLSLSRIKFRGVSLGVTWVFFAGIVAGHFGLTADTAAVRFAQNFGLVLFVYALGLQVGPGFINSFRKGGLSLNMLGLLSIFVSTVMALLLTLVTPVGVADMMGVLCGASTNTPALGAVQQTLAQMGLPETSPALATALAYPFGVVGVMVAIMILKRMSSKTQEHDRLSGGEDETFIATFDVLNPAVIGKTIEEVADMSGERFIISRVWRNHSVVIPSSDTLLQEGDRCLVITKVRDINHLTAVLGRREEGDWNRDDIDWNAMDRHFVSQPVLVTNKEINGKRLSELKLRNRYGVNVTRVFRGGMALLATPDLMLQVGDRVVVVGKDASLPAVAEELGDTVKTLNEPNLISICLGIVIGLAIGAIPIFIPSMSAPVKIGIAGGPIIAGILMGAYGPRIHMVTYTTESANLMLRRLGLSMYLAALGLLSGPQFFETVMRPEGLVWILTGAFLAVVPVVLVGWLSMKVWHVDFGSTAGMLCASMANPMALGYADDLVSNDNPSLAYTTVYPLSMFARVVVVQVVVILFCM
ncbi:MAG: putative transporter [Bacteroidales bacterium]|nr:putative transporter [Bacteroidales bacterium]